MFDFVLEKYPVSRALTNGKQIEVRPLQAEDERAFREFYEGIAEKERFLMKHRLGDADAISRWVRALDYEECLPLLALEDGKVVGYATLNQRPGGWKRHIGTVDAQVDPKFRGLGVIRALLGELVEIASHGGLTKLEAEFNGERQNSIASFGKCGFIELVRLTDYLQDMQAQHHDYVLMGLDLSVPYENAGAGD